MHRRRVGQSPHVDFHTPIGWLAYGLPYPRHLALDQYGGERHPKGTGSQGLQGAVFSGERSAERIGPTASAQQ